MAYRLITVAPKTKLVKPLQPPSLLYPTIKRPLPATFRDNQDDLPAPRSPGHVRPLALEARRLRYGHPRVRLLAHFLSRERGHLAIVVRPQSGQDLNVLGAVPSDGIAERALGEHPVAAAALWGE